MAKNASTFEDYLKKQDITLEKKEHEDSVGYAIRENIEDVGPITVVVLFNNNDRIVTVISYQYLRIINPAKKQDFIELINVLNSEYTMVKFTESSNSVSVQTTVPFNNNFNPEVVVEMISLVLQAIKEEQSRFMKLM